MQKRFTLQAKDFNLGRTLSCGQFFRFFPANGGFYVQTRDAVFFAHQKGDQLHIQGNASPRYIRDFFRLEEDRSELFSLMSGYRDLRHLPTRYPGLRLIRQDPWECLVSYMCATAANIPKIKDNIETLAAHFGKELRFDNRRFFTFPSPGQLDCERTLRECKCGYRASFIEAVNRSVSERWLKEMRKMSYENAKSRLTGLYGVGEKVADCVLLFSLGHDEAFPVDTRIRRVMRELFVPDGTDRKIRDFAKERFGQWAGYVQQYLYLLGEKA